MQIKIKTQIIFSAGCLSLALYSMIPARARAAAEVAVGICPDGGNSCGAYSYTKYFQAFYKYSLRLGAMLSVMMIIYAGYLYLFSQGDSSKLTAAKDILVGTILGFLLLLVINLILDFIGLPKL